MPKAVLDENVSFQVAERLQLLGLEVIAIAKLSNRGMRDEEVFNLVADSSTLLITRDHHFTNSVRFPPSRTGGILYITSSNLKGQQEADLVEQFLRAHPPESFSSHLVFLSVSGARIR